jgi:NAD(P)-dependent dehydrogenase (short-subunit alcohol dehydrogenase family)
MERLKNKVAIITGGATGIGEAITKKFIREGAKVVVAGMPQDPVEDVVNSIKDGKVIGWTGDLANEEQAAQCVEVAVKEFGQLDILINNAGIFPEVEELPDYSIESFDNMIRNNLRTAFLMSRFALPHLQKSKGCIVSAGSEAGKIGIVNNAPYGGTKGFMHAFMRGLAVEQAKNGIRVNCVCPGAVDTAWTHKDTGPMNDQMTKTMVEATPLARRGTPEEIANVYAFVASDEASFMTGALVMVDGGITVSKGTPGTKVPEELRQAPEGVLETSHSMDGATERR